ncbi:MAG: PKD domain-containing protein [Nitrospinae bacterium]|nr:PKD domain-containing protein [Nitrospinota bacterium]
MNTRFIARLALVAFILIGAAGCGMSLDKEKGSANPSGTKLNLKWPNGYRYDQVTRKLMRPSSPVRMDTPIYVTRVTLTVTGDDMEPIYADVPLDTLTVDLTLTFGERYFDVLVETELGETFTGTETLTVSPYMPPVLEIELEVNAPPIITAIDISNYYPMPGESLTVTGYAEDADPDDTLTYSWYGYGPNGSISFEGPSFTENMPSGGGEFTIFLTVDDGHGGIAQAEQTIYVQGTPPYIRDMFVSDTAPKVGDTVRFDAYVTDDDPGDILDYLWTIVTPQSGVVDIQGEAADFTIPDMGQYDITLTVNDQQGNYVYSTMTLNVGCGYPTPLAPVITSVIPGTPGTINVGYQYPGGSAGELADGIVVYNVDWQESSSASGAPLTGSGNQGGYPMNGLISFSCTTGVFYSFQVSAGNSCLVAGPPSSALPVAGAWVGCP